MTTNPTPAETVVETPAKKFKLNRNAKIILTLTASAITGAVATVLIERAYQKNVAGTNIDFTLPEIELPVS